MKKWLIPLVGLTLAVAVAATTVALAVGGGESDEPPTDQPPILSDEGIDPDECNLVHNTTACEGEPEPDFDIGEPDLLPQAKDPEGPAPCEPGQTVAVTSDGQTQCLDSSTDASTDGQEPVGEPPGQVEPLPPVRSDEGIDPDECNWVHNITACDGEELPELEP